MCGIFCCIPHSSHNHDCFQNTKVQKLLQNRGPNSSNIVNNSVGIFAGFVLWHQGSKICYQPIHDEEFILLFNGDIYNLTTEAANQESDSKWLFKQIQKCENEAALIDLFRKIEGPFSIILYKHSSRSLYFARDAMGRTSLIIEKNSEHFRILSTTNIQDINSIEVPSLGFFKVNVENINDWTLYPWQSLDDFSLNRVKHVEQSLCINIKNGLAINVCWLQQKLCSKSISFNFYDMVGNYSFTTGEDLFQSLLKDNNISSALNNFSKLLENSVQNRVNKTIPFCKNCLDTRRSCNHTKIAILFSGGLDCTLLAVLTDKFLNKSDSIDLINVAFEPANVKIDNWEVPDRLTGKASLVDLQQLCPNRTWNFIEVNVTRHTLEEALKTHLKDVIYPLNTVLDESIGCALWFAATGKGIVNDLEWNSSARVVLIGTGADELFGGYVRHKNAYLRHPGNDAEKQFNVQKELQYDWNRISYRNLARDDRVISDTGKTPRAPFIEEHVLHYISSLNSSQRCCFVLPEGIGDKLFLRLYAYQLGLKFAPFLKKRAIQFGSKIATKSQKASDRSTYIK